VKRLFIALLVSGIGLAAAPNFAHAQSSRVGSIMLPSGVYYPTSGKANKAKGKHGNAKRDYLDANGCKVKEETKPNGDYKYERKCKNADKNLAKARKDAEKRAGKDRNGDIYGTHPQRDDRYSALQRLGIGIP
jgi:hypothetical protein